MYDIGIKFGMNEWMNEYVYVREIKQDYHTPLLGNGIKNVLNKINVTNIQQL